MDEYVRLYKSSETPEDWSRRSYILNVAQPNGGILWRR